MSIEAVNYVWGLEAPNPLAKLLLVYLADNGDGTCEINVERCAAFCCCTEDEISATVSDLVARGLLVPAGWSTAVRIGGYTPRSIQPTRGYTKRQISYGLRMRVFERDGFTCQSCGSQRSLTVDHIKPEVSGGTLELVNLQTLCRPCNSRKGAR